MKREHRRSDQRAARAGGWVVLLLAVAGLAAMALVPGAAGRRAQPAPPRAAPAARPLAVYVHERDPGAPVPERFLGLSFELASLPQVASYAEGGNLVALLRSLGPGVIRFGGASADTRVAWTDAATPRPAWASSVVTESDLQNLRRLAQASGWRVMLTIGLAHFDPVAAAREAAAAKAALGPWLAAIELGNEPDAYALHGLRRRPWTFARYASQLAAYRSAIARTAPGIPLAGPDVSGSGAFARWGSREARSERPAVLTGHHYPLGCHDAVAPTIAALLSAGTRSLERRSLAHYVAVARASSLGVRLDETGSVSCGGRAGVSNTFAAALWAVGYLANAMETGAAGVNFEGNPSNCRGYSPLCATGAALGHGMLTPQPEWYALLICRALVGDLPLASSVAAAGPADVDVATFLAPDGALHAVLVDDERPGAAPVAVSLHVGRGLGAASLLSLTAPSLAAGSGLELGGRPVAPDGSYAEPAALPRVAPHAGVLTVTLPPASAVLLTAPRAPRP